MAIFEEKERDIATQRFLEILNDDTTALVVCIGACVSGLVSIKLFGDITEPWILFVCNILLFVAAFLISIYLCIVMKGPLKSLQ